MGWIIGAVLIVGPFIIAVFLIRKRWRFHDTPTSDAAHVFPGLSEVHGVVEAPWGTLASPSDGAPCVWWTYTVERYVKTKDSSHWEREEAGITHFPFLLRDTSGAVTVMLDNSSTIGRADDQDIEHLSLSHLRPLAKHLTETYDQGKLARMLGFDNNFDEPITQFAGSWRAREHRVRVGDHLFITANAQIAPDGASVHLRPIDNDGKRTLFEVTVGDEKQALASQAGKGLIGGCMALSLAASVVLGVQWAKAASTSAPGKLAITTLPLLVAATTLLIIGAYNRLRRVRERVDFAWSLIDVAHTQRATLVPQLNTVVVSAMNHERSLLEALTTTRTVGRHPSGDGVGHVSTVSSAAEQLVVRAEAYPNLTSQPNVAQLMAQLQLLNDRVAFGRRFYNDSVERLANRCTVFPDSLFAKALRISPPPYFELLEPPTSPRVDLAPPTAPTF